MFKDEESLPLTEVEDAIRDGDALLCVGYRCSEVGRHVIGALAGVGVGRIPFRGEFLDPALQVVSRRGIGIFCDDEAGTGVSDEDRADTGLDIGPFHRLGNGTGDLMKPASRSLKCDGFPEQIAPFCRTLRLIGKSNAPRIMYTTHRRRMGKKMSVIARFAILLLLPLVGCLDQGTGVPRSQSRPTTAAPEARTDEPVARPGPWAPGHGPNRPPHPTPASPVVRGCPHPEQMVLLHPHTGLPDCAWPR